MFQVVQQFEGGEISKTFFFNSTNIKILPALPTDDNRPDMEKSMH
jgi:hypothetical protein